MKRISFDLKEFKKFLDLISEEYGTYGIDEVTQCIYSTHEDSYVTELYGTIIEEEKKESSEKIYKEFLGKENGKEKD